MHLQDTSGRTRAAAGVPTSDGRQRIDVIGANTTIEQIQITPAAAAYGNGDVIYGQHQLAPAFRGNGLGALLQSVTFADPDKQNADLDIIICNTDMTGASSVLTDHVALSIDAADAPYVLARVRIEAADYLDLGGFSLAQKFNLAIPLQARTNDDDLFVIVVSRGTPTYTAVAHVLNLGLIKD